jgi:uncharacterized protein YjiS (DUF1127 family)
MHRANLKNPRFANLANPARLPVLDPRVWRHIQANFKVWSDRHQTRRQLRELLLQDPDRLVSDLGLGMAAAEAESRKWFWQA